MTDELKLTQAQKYWLHPILEQFGAWIYSGRLDRRQTSIISQFMSRMRPAEYSSRPMCSDDDGRLISAIWDEIYATSRTAWVLLFCRYVYGSSDRHLARVYRDALMIGDADAAAGNDPVKCLISRRASVRRSIDIPSLSTCRRESLAMIESAEMLVYLRLTEAMAERDRLDAQNNWLKIQRRVG
ncbi:antiterminator Q family protein [Dickeya solani]|uniref:Antiterminator Q family protein n=1 Tax=Dickeya solani TaxID=1089444 RepID=A0ABU4EL56_9GAMM|nr:antiterminator Q family protein [Dickeya solani]MCA6998197.1 antiterminator [Dickeya solani]MDV6997172.1 antiterminator Q family protein [Dickeya solani]MDV7004483.1 antiterminator Q family protein [Dickeya solani]MDV7040355.1 antiterminator Q family protein [Dickeya solani]MDV7044806.1 antiterminator Q family protein [Dickeya solani]